MATITGNAIERKFMAHFLNATPAETTPTFVRLGKDLTELKTELSMTVDKKVNIIGETSIKIHDRQAQSSVEPFYAEVDEPLFEWLQDLIDNKGELDKLRTDYVEVHLWTGAETETSFEAIKEEVYIEITSYGGDTSGYQIPFNIHHTGRKTKGTFNVSSKTFTPN